MGGRSDELASSRKRQGLLDKLESFRKRNGADQSPVSLCISLCVRAMRMTCGCHVAHVQCRHGAQECHQGTHWSSEGCQRIALRARVLHGWCRGDCYCLCSCLRRFEYDLSRHWFSDLEFVSPVVGVECTYCNHRNYNRSDCSPLNSCDHYNHCNHCSHFDRCN